ncbi:hemerythrin domain-containing protein [Aminobacter sp. AP02]|uniref:hemerythrin domain-containing protein n=1 Tax=Aminobacter sp. AP02 TaxID=2135737 RepID=UPI000D7A7DBE|nr:hemerythrin domain-containing protein [Aminobacter sp. AP02]PWK63399.1 hemerythrin HHE cation binding domain-containing protein [Aminobacter sp. AP02]
MLDAVAVMRRAHVAKLALCDRLEAIADSLPAGLNRRECLLAARALGPGMAETHRFEEIEIYPHFAASLGQSAEARKTVARLKHEHFEDEGYAAELRDALRFAARWRRAQNPETLGFMLRGFFGAVRRHVAFERDHVLAQLSPPG